MQTKIKTVGVIGAGQMGKGITHVCALSGYSVWLYDINEKCTKEAFHTIEANLRRQLNKGLIKDADKKEAIERIHCVVHLDELADCDLIIESVAENEQIKNKVLSQVCPLLKSKTILSTNTSSLSITRLAAITDRPERFIGIHFMNPAPIIPLVELVRGIATDEQTFETCKAFVESLGKTICIVAEDYPAFIVNRILLPMINEAIYTLYEGVGTVEAIDTALRLGASHPMGPLQLADFIGLDTCLSIMQVLHDGLSEAKFRPCPLLVKYVEAGWLGRKTNRGFYDYRHTPPIPTR